MTPPPDQVLSEALARLQDDREQDAEALWQMLDEAALEPVAAARLRLLKGCVQLVRGELDAGLTRALPALNELDALHERRELAWVHGFVGFRLGIFGDPERGLEYAGRALAQNPADDMASRALFMGWRGCLHDMAGDSDEARADMTRALDLITGREQPVLEARLSRWLAFALLRRAERAEHDEGQTSMLAWARQALLHARRGALLADQTALPRALSYAHRQLAHALALLGEVDEAAAELSLAMSAIVSELDVPIQVGCLCTQARISRLRGRHDNARQALEDAIALSAQHPDNSDLEAPLRDLVQLEAEAGRWPLALAASRRLQSHLEACHRHQPRALRRHAEVFAEAERYRIQAEEMRDEAARLSADNQHLAQRERDWRDQALRDALTGLCNRRGFELAVAEAESAGRAFDLALIDVDHFKRVNDRFGHPVGDAVLAALARLLAGGCRQSDRVARLGGEEFVLLLPHGDTASQRTCERLRAAVQGFDWAAIHAELAVTISLGLARPLAGQRWQAQLERADQALYAAKQGGRNQLRQAD